MSHSNAEQSGFQKATDWLLKDGKLLILGSSIAVIWVHIDLLLGAHTLEHFAHLDLRTLFMDVHAHGHVPEQYTLHYAIGVTMALFFGKAGGEVKEATSRGGDLHPFSKAATPLWATAGGVLGPVAVYLGLAFIAGKFYMYLNGWAIPTATDIAFSYLFGNWIFGKGSRAVQFLLLLAIADDALGLCIIAGCYTDFASLNWWWMLLPLVAAFGAKLTPRVFFRSNPVEHTHWAYAPWMLMSLIGFIKTGVEPALGLIPVIWFMPCQADQELFEADGGHKKDTLNRFVHFWEPYIEVVLLAFAIVNVGVAWNGIGLGTGLVFSGLVVGKTLGVLAFVWLAVEFLGCKLPDGMGYRHVAVLGMVAGVGFTVALFVAGKAFVGPEAVLQLTEAKLGALGSLLAGGLAMGLAKILGVKPEPPTEKS